MRKLLALLFLIPLGMFAQFTNTASHLRNGSTLPVSCQLLTGDVFIKDSAGSTGPYYCSAPNTWTPMSGAGGSPGGSDTQLQYNNSGSFGGAADFTYVSHTLAGGASSILNMSAGKFLLPTANTAGSGISITTVSGTSQIAFDSSVLVGNYVPTDGTATVIGVGKVFTSSGTAGSLGLSANTIPTAIASGYWNYDTSGKMSFFDGTNIQYLATFAGAVRVAPTAITAGKCLEAGTNFTIVVAASNAACGSGGVSNYYTSTTKTGIGPASFTPSKTFTVYDATASTGSTNMFVSPGAGQSGNLQVWQRSTSTPQTASANDVGIRVATNGQMDVLLGDQSDFATLSFKSFSFSGGFSFTNSGSKISMGGGGQVSNRVRIIQGEGVPPTVSGCGTNGSSIAATSFANAGVITGITTTGSCTLTLTPGMTVDTGFACAYTNQTTANLIRQTASNATTSTAVGVTVSGDTILYQCQAY